MAIDYEAVGRVLGDIALGLAAGFGGHRISTKTLSDRVTALEEKQTSAQAAQERMHRENKENFDQLKEELKEHRESVHEEFSGVARTQEGHAQKLFDQYGKIMELLGAAAARRRT